MPHMEFHVPFTKRDNPALIAARTSNLAWLQRFGLLAGEAAVKQYLTADIADFCSMAHPGARGEDLNTVVDAWSWMVFPDDLFDGPAGRDPGLVTRTCRRFVAIIEDWPHARPDADNPMETALHDLWGRLTAGMSTAWVRHRARLWADYLMSHVNEASNRDSGYPPPAGDYIKMRRVSIAAWPTLLAERAGHFHVPATVVAHPLWRELHETWINAIAWINDVYSLEKDESFGDVSNIVLVLQHHHHLDRAHALRRVQDLVRNEAIRFVHLRDAMVSADYGSDLTATGRENIGRYLAAMEDYAAANYFYSRHVPRYSPHGGSPAERLSYVQHLRTPL